MPVSGNQDIIKNDPPDSPYVQTSENPGDFSPLFSGLRPRVDHDPVDHDLRGGNQVDHDPRGGNHTGVDHDPWGGSHQGWQTTLQTLFTDVSYNFEYRD
jgi:hypothetical protein